MSGRKKLYLCQHETKETIIDIYKANEWEDFLIVRVNSDRYVITQEIIDNVSAVFEQLDLNDKYKKIIVMPAIDIEIYGVEVDE